MQPVHQFLRDATRQDHESVDAAFGAFQLDTRRGYAHLLLAHARILPVAERLVAPGELLAGWVGRTDCLMDDLATLGLPRPSGIDFSLPGDEAARWGAIYVIEGSRLGGLMLKRMVPQDMPSAYLSAGHGPGQWRTLLGKLDNAEEGGQAWRDAALNGAKLTFAAYSRAAEAERREG
jgi:heme oxygenase